MQRATSAYVCLFICFAIIVFPCSQLKCRKLGMRARVYSSGIPHVGTHHSHSVPFSFAQCVLYETNIFALSSFIRYDVFSGTVVGRTWNQFDSAGMLHICGRGYDDGYYYYFFILWASFSLFAWAAFAFVFIFRYWRSLHIYDRRITFCLLHIVIQGAPWHVLCISGSAIAITTHEQNVYIGRHCVVRSTSYYPIMIYKTHKISFGKSLVEIVCVEREKSSRCWKAQFIWGGWRPWCCESLTRRCKRRFDIFHHCVHRRSGGNSHRTATIREHSERKKNFFLRFFLRRLLLRKIVNRLDTHFEAKILSLMIIIIIMCLFAFPSGHSSGNDRDAAFAVLFPGIFNGVETTSRAVAVNDVSSSIATRNYWCCFAKCLCSNC